MSVILVGTVEEALRMVIGKSASHCSIQGAKMLIVPTVLASLFSQMTRPA